MINEREQPYLDAGSSARSLGSTVLLGRERISYRRYRVDLSLSLFLSFSFFLSRSLARSLSLSLILVRVFAIASKMSLRCPYPRHESVSRSRGPIFTTIFVHEQSDSHGTVSGTFLVGVLALISLMVTELSPVALSPPRNRSLLCVPPGSPETITNCPRPLRVEPTDPDGEVSLLFKMAFRGYGRLDRGGSFFLFVLGPLLRVT